jgi:hypothetical protein
MFPMNKVIAAVLVVGVAVNFYFIGYQRGKFVGTQETCGALVEKLEKELDTQKELGYEGVIENLQLNGCKNIAIRAVNKNHEVKLVQYLGDQMIDGTKTAKVLISGTIKNFEYHNFMKKVVKIECFDSFKW